ncbi:MAG: lipopolysaccharide transport periplasmic protein LptA [Janthinobacterium lividum]
MPAAAIATAATRRRLTLVARAVFASVYAAAAAALLCAAPAHAEQADRDKPINVEADNMTYDDLHQVNVLTGNVVITKGTIIIRGNRVEIRQDPQGYQYATSFAGTVPAYFRQKRDVGNEYVEGHGQRIDYDGKNDITTLTTRADVRRLQGLSTVLDEVHGSVIRYDGQRDFYTATSGQDASSPGNPTGRVRATLAPRNITGAPLDGAPTRLAPAPTPGNQETQ